MRILFRSNLDEVGVWLLYLNKWPDNIVPPVGSEITIKHPSYKCNLTLRVVKLTFPIIMNEYQTVSQPDCMVELHLPTFLHSIAEWEEWYKRHFK